MAFLSASLCKAVFLQCATCRHRKPFAHSLFTVQKCNQFACLDAAGVQRTWGYHNAKLCRVQEEDVEDGKWEGIRPKNPTASLYILLAYWYHVISYHASNHTLYITPYYVMLHRTIHHTTHHITHHVIHDIVHHIIHKHTTSSYYIHHRYISLHLISSSLIVVG